jgi:ATP-dependent DNA ligase
MKPPTYPLRPINGGPLERARPKRGEWVYQPKINGWRAMVNTKTGQIFNRHGEPLTIASEFQCALEDLRVFSKWEWLDCEGLSRRHGIEKGKLYVLDYIPESYDKTPFSQRHAAIMEAFPDRFLECYPEDQALHQWEKMQLKNKELGCEFFEGFVAKRVDSPYPRQLRSDKEETSLWVKHRWEF